MAQYNVLKIKKEEENGWPAKKKKMLPTFGLLETWVTSRRQLNYHISRDYPSRTLFDVTASMT
jgi:hypothetical protein